MVFVGSPASAWVFALVAMIRARWKRLLAGALAAVGLFIGVCLTCLAYYSLMQGRRIVGPI